jgi:hypothetical protein
MQRKNAFSCWRESNIIIRSLSLRLSSHRSLSLRPPQQFPCGSLVQAASMGMGQCPLSLGWILVLIMTRPCGRPVKVLAHMSGQITELRRGMHELVKNRPWTGGGRQIGGAGASGQAGKPGDGPCRCCHGQRAHRSFQWRRDPYKPWPPAFPSPLALPPAGIDRHHTTTAARADEEWYGRRG